LKHTDNFAISTFNTIRITTLEPDWLKMTISAYHRADKACQTIVGMLSQGSGERCPIIFDAIILIKQEHM
jgi:hypothetical protein